MDDPLPGHDQFRGYLSIPYLRWSPWRKWSTASIRFRRLDDGTPKYQTVAGDKPRLFNTNALTNYSKDMCIAEGELDAITAEMSGLACVGVPGSQMWKPHFAELFKGYRHVNVFADGDEAGMEFARTVAKTLPNSRIIPCPPGMDVNSLYLSEGPEALYERI